MAERLNTTQLQRQEGLEAPENGAGIALEIVDDISRVEGQFAASLEELAISEIDDVTVELTGESSEHKLDGAALQRKYDTPYNPIRTIKGIADIAMFAASPGLVREHVERATVEVVDTGDAEIIPFDRERTDELKTIYRENGLAYAQDQPETMQYAAEATRIIDALIEGDERALGGLPPRFVEALRVRAQSYENGISADEREAMISVACNGLAEIHGEALSIAGSSEAKAQDEAWEQDQAQQRAA